MVNEKYGLNIKINEVYTENKKDEMAEFKKKLEKINNPEEKVISMSVPSEASIYRESAKDLVEQDRRDHPVVPEETEETIEPLTPSPADNLEEKPKVLERKLNNNPWSGIETVSPGQLKL